MSDFNDTVGIFPGDAIIKAIVELAIDDMRKHPWVIEDVFRIFREHPILKMKYGEKEIQRAKEFIMNNKIPVYMRHRVDKQEFPCVTISIGPSQEDKDLATLGDLDICVEDLNPCDIDQPIQYIVPPFNVVSYDKETGVVEVPQDVEEYRYIDKGMVAVDPDTGAGFIVIDKVAPHSFSIAKGSELPGGQLAIVPRYALYRARRERAISQEQYNIGCHAHGDPSTLLFLYGLVKYSLFRYREGLLEESNFQLSRLTSTDMIKNSAFDVENIYSRFITLQGQVQESWVKSPQRFIEGVDMVDGNPGENGLTVGITVLANGDTPESILDEECDLWITKDTKE